MVRVRTIPVHARLSGTFFLVFLARGKSLQGLYTTRTSVESPGPDREPDKYHQY